MTFRHSTVIMGWITRCVNNIGAFLSFNFFFTLTNMCVDYWLVHISCNGGSEQINQFSILCFMLFLSTTQSVQYLRCDVKVDKGKLLRYHSLWFINVSIITFLFETFYCRVFIVNRGTLATLVCCIKYITFRSILHCTRNSLYPLTWDVIGL